MEKNDITTHPLHLRVSLCLGACRHALRCRLLLALGHGALTTGECAAAAAPHVAPFKWPLFHVSPAPLRQRRAADVLVRTGSACPHCTADFTGGWWLVVTSFQASDVTVVVQSIKIIGRIGIANRPIQRHGACESAALIEERMLIACFLCLRSLWRELRAPPLLIRTSSSSSSSRCLVMIA